MRKRKTAAILLSALLTLSLFACGDTDPAAAPPTDTLSGDLPTILASILDGANARLEELDKFTGGDFGFHEDSVTLDNCKSVLGLEPGEFEQYVTEAYFSTPEIMPWAHEVVLIRCKDFTAAAEVKRLVAAGYDAGKWVCVFPDEGFVMDSGSYVLLAATSAKGTAALRQSFESVAQGFVGEADVFYVYTDGGDGDG